VQLLAKLISDDKDQLIIEIRKAFQQSLDIYQKEILWGKFFSSQSIRMGLGAPQLPEGSKMSIS